MKATACTLIAVVLSQMLNKQNKDFATLVSILGCSLVAMAAMNYLQHIITFITTLSQIGQMDNQMVRILLKITGIGIIGELASLLCADSGNGALAKTLQLLSSAVMLYLSLPLVEATFELVRKILGGI